MTSSLHTLRQRLTGLTEYLPHFERRGFNFGEWNGAEESQSNELTMPMFKLSDTAEAFVQAVYDLGWVRADFDWGEWMQTQEASRLRDDSDALATATPDQLARLLTVLIRQERFCEGSLGAAYESGLLSGILRRMAALASDAPCCGGSTPNLYDFATSELSQDATLAYILSWAKPQYKTSNPDLNRLGNILLRALVATSAQAQGKPSPLDGILIEQLQVGRQRNHLDVWASVNDSIFLIIEDKVRTCEHSRQISRYTKLAKTLRNKSDQPWQAVMPVYVKTGNEPLRRMPSEKTCGRFMRNDLLRLLNEVPHTTNTIVEDFRRHLENWQKQTRSFLLTPPPAWSRAATEGFYLELESWLYQANRNTPQWGPDWGTVSNPNGNFLAFWWHRVRLQKPDCNAYLQFSGGTKLEIRVSDAGNAEGKCGKHLMWASLHALQEVAKAKCFAPIRLRKSGWFRGGRTAAVADVSFDDNQDTCVAVNQDRLLDLPRTKQRLLLTMDLLDALSADCDGATA